VGLVQHDGARGNAVRRGIEINIAKNRTGALDIFQRCEPLIIRCKASAVCLAPFDSVRNFLNSLTKECLEFVIGSIGKFTRFIGKVLIDTSIRESDLCRSVVVPHNGRALAVALPWLGLRHGALRGQPCAKRAGRAWVEAPDLGADQGLRLVDKPREFASHTATGVFAGPGEPSDCQLSLQGSKSSTWNATE